MYLFRFHSSKQRIFGGLYSPEREIRIKPATNIFFLAPIIILLLPQINIWYIHTLIVLLTCISWPQIWQRCSSGAFCLELFSYLSLNRCCGSDMQTLWTQRDVNYTPVCLPELTVRQQIQTQSQLHPTCDASGRLSNVYNDSSLIMQVSRFTNTHVSDVRRKKKQDGELRRV